MKSEYALLEMIRNSSVDEKCLKTSNIKQFMNLYGIGVLCWSTQPNSARCDWRLDDDFHLANFDCGSSHLYLCGSSAKTQSRYSLNFQLARLYLAACDIQLHITDEGYLQLGKVVFKPIDFPTGGYQQFYAGGHQILLNYRSSRQVAKLVSVAQVLNGQFNPNWVKDKIVLIGVDLQSVKDYRTYATGIKRGRADRANTSLRWLAQGGKRN